MTATNSGVFRVRRVTVMQGEAKVSSRPEDVFSTVLGSCVAVCLYDPSARVGGLNHYLLSEMIPGKTEASLRYGVHLMEVLMKSMLAQGATRERLRAKIFGGARMHPGFGDIGVSNVRFAHRFLEKERIVIVGEDTGGVLARRVEMRAAEGLLRCRTVGASPVIRTSLQALGSVGPEAVGDVIFPDTDFVKGART